MTLRMERPLNQTFLGIDRGTLGNALRITALVVLSLALSGAIAVTAAEVGPLFVVPLVLMIPVALIFFRYPFVSFIVWLLIFPFIVRTNMGSAGVAVYYAVHRAMIPGLLWFVLLRSWGVRKQVDVRLGPADLVVVLSFLWTLGNLVLLSTHTVESLVNLYDRQFVPYCMYFLIRLLSPTATDLKRLLPVAFITLMAQATIGMVSWFSPHLLPTQWMGEAGDRVVGTFKNPAVYTSTCIFLSLLIFQYGIQSPKRWLRLLGLFALGVGLLCMLMSFSRGSWLGGALVIIGLIFVYRRIMLPFAIAGFVLITVLGLTVFSNELSYAAARLNDQETAQSRLLTGAKSLGMIEQRPLFGWGYGNYDVYDDGFRVTTTDPGSIKESDHTSHNTYLTVMAELGIPGLFLYLIPTGWWFVVTLSVWKRLRRSGFWSQSLVVLLWLLILDHITVSSFMDMIRFNLFGTSIYWIALGFIASIVAPYHQAAQDEPVRFDQPSTQLKTIEVSS